MGVAEAPAAALTQTVRPFGPAGFHRLRGRRVPGKAKPGADVPWAMSKGTATAGMVIAAGVAMYLAALRGSSRLDVMACGLPASLCAWWWSVPSAGRPSLVRWQMPLLAAAAVAGGVVLAAVQAAPLGAPVPWSAGVLFGGRLFAWLALLRAFAAALDRLLTIVVRRAAWRVVSTSLLLVVVVFPQLWVALQTHRLPIAPPPGFAGTRMYEDVRFVAADGVPLVGTLLPHANASPRTPVVIVCHGLGSNRATFLGYAQIALELGCHALLFDFRGHGASGSAATTFGAHEVGDVAAAVGWLRAEPRFAAAPVVLVGVSMGAATALQAAALVGAAGVFAESSFADLPSMVARQAAALGDAAQLAVAAVAMAARLQLGVDLASVSPRASLAALPAHVPVVLVHAGDDEVVPRCEGERLAAARPGLRLHVVAGASHGGCSVCAPVRVRGWLAELLVDVERG